MTDRDSYAEGTPSFVDLMTTDVDAAREFYADLFGWNWTSNDTGDPDKPYFMADLRGRAVAGLSQQPQEQVDMGVPPVWTTYITVDDVDAATTKVAGLGGTVMAPAFDVMDAGRMAVIVDPSGAVVALWQAKESPGAMIVNEPGTFAWAELQTSDQVAAREFYVKLLGWTTSIVDMSEMGGEGDMTLFQLAGSEGDIANAMESPMPGVPSHWHTYFAVDDCDATCARVKELGGTQLMDAFDSPPGRMCPVTDPTGAVFSVIALNEPPA